VTVHVPAAQTSKLSGLGEQDVGVDELGQSEVGVSAEHGLDARKRGIELTGPDVLHGVDQQRLEAGPLKEYSQFGEGIPFGEATPRAGNDSGGGQPGRILKCKGWETDPDAYTYFITQAAVWPKICDLIGKPEWKDDPGYAKPDARFDKIPQIFDAIEEWTKTLDKFEVMRQCNPLNIPCGPILSMKELSQESSLRETGTVVEVDHPERGPYLTVGNPVKLSESPSDVKRAPLLGEHTEEILKSVVGLSDDEIAAAREAGAI